MDLDSDLIIDDSSSSSVDLEQPHSIVKFSATPRPRPIRLSSSSDNNDRKHGQQRSKLNFSHKKRRIIREMDFSSNLRTTHKSPPSRRLSMPTRRRSKDQSIWGNLNHSAHLTEVSVGFSQTQSPNLDETAINDESDADDQVEKLEIEVFGPYGPSPHSSRVSSGTMISDSPTPPDEKQIYSSTFQFYKRPPPVIKYLKGGLAEEFEKHLKLLKSDTSQWLHGRQNFIQAPGKLVKVKQINPDFYGRRIVSYTNHITGCDYFLFFDANEKQLANLQVGQRLEFEQDYSKHRMHLKESLKIDLDFAVAETSDSVVCNVLLNVIKIKMHNT